MIHQLVNINPSLAQRSCSPLCQCVIVNLVKNPMDLLITSRNQKSSITITNVRKCLFYPAVLVMSSSLDAIKTRALNQIARRASL